MKINIAVEIKPGTAAPQGTAQHLIEQVAIAIASNQIEGRIENEFGQAGFTVATQAQPTVHA